MMTSGGSKLLYSVQAVRTSYRSPSGDSHQSSPCRLNKAQKFFVLIQRTLAALLGYFILIGRSCRPGLLTARLAGSGEPRNLKPLAEMPMREHQGHAQGSTGE